MNLRKKNELIWLVIFLVFSLWTEVQLHGQENQAEKFYRQWLMNGGWQQQEAARIREAQLKQAQAEYDALKALQRTYDLTIEIDKLNRQLNEQINLKGKLWNEKLSNERVEVNIKKLSKDLKGKVDDLYKLTK